MTQHAKNSAKETSAAATQPDGSGAKARGSASVLTTTQVMDKRGPRTKAESAAKGDAPPAAARAAIIVPPMPAKPNYAKAKATTAIVTDEDRRSFLQIGFWLLGAVSVLWTLASVKFMFPNVLREPPTKFKVGFPDAYPPGQVAEKYKAQFGVWVANVEYNGSQEIVALKTVCTHLGCTPNWLEAEQKFKCPCHGSGFYKDGTNFEGPAPRPLERFAISIASDGQIEVDKSHTFQEEMGQWTDPRCYISA